MFERDPILTFAKIFAIYKHGNKNLGRPKKQVIGIHSLFHHLKSLMVNQMDYIKVKESIVNTIQQHFQFNKGTC